MIVRRGLPAPGAHPPCTLAVGNFDGVHLGHRALLARAVAAARAAGLMSVALTFHPHPRAVVNGGEPPALTPFPEKARELAALGVDELVVARFRPALRELSPDTFAREAVVRSLAARAVHVGWNFAFGRGGAGRPEELAALGRALGFAVHVEPPVAVDGFSVSSSKIRLLLAAGSVEEAEAFLGRPYSVTGRVVHGNGLGRGLGCPTANLAPSGGLRKALPKCGVYAALTEVDGRDHPSVANVGRRPTLGEGLATTIETHLLDFTGDLYGRVATLRFKKRLRDEEKFDNLETLRDAIAADRGEARRYFGRARHG